MPTIRYAYRLAAVLIVLTGFIPTPMPWVHAQPVNIILVTARADGNDADVTDGICSTGGGNPQCTLRAAVQTANASTGPDRILLGSDTYLLSLPGSDDQAARGDLDVRGVIEIVANPGAPGPLTIDSNTSDDPIFETHPGAVLTLNGLTLIGRSDSALRLRGGSARLFAMTVTGEGAVWGIRQVSGNLHLENSTITGNGRGGVRIQDGTALLYGVTIAANGQDQQADSAGLSNPEADDDDSNARVTVRNSILANNRSVDCAGPKIWAGINLVETRDGECGLAPGVLTQDPALQPLANNGGPTRTLAPAPGSPAVNAGGACDLGLDQRGVGRPQGGACDLGAFEYPVARLAQPTWTTTDVAGQVPIGVQLDRPLAFPVQVALASSNGSAQAGVDYTALTGPVTLAAGTTAITASLTILDRPQATDTLTLTVSLAAGPAPVVLPVAPVSGVVTINDTAASEVPAQFQTANASVVAGASAELQVALSQAPTVTSTVNYATVGASAQPGLDFTPVSGSLTFAPGQTVASLSVPTVANPSAAPSVEFSVVLTAGVGTVAVPPTTAVVTINRPGPQILRLPGLYQGFSPIREREPNNTTGTATGPIEPGLTYFGAYNASGNALDPDVWSFDVTGPDTVSIAVTGLDSGGQIWLRHSNGTQLGFAGAAPFAITAALPDAGRYSVGVVSTSQLGAGEYQLRLTLP